MNLFRGAKDGFKTAQHSIPAADNFGLVLCASHSAFCIPHSAIRLVEPRRQADAAGHGIQFGDSETRFRQQNVGPDDAGDIVFERRRTLEFNQSGRFAAIQQFCNPCRLLAFHAAPVKQVDGAVKLQQHPAQRFNFLRQIFIQRKRLRRNAPVESGKKFAVGNLFTNELRGIRRGFDVGRNYGHAEDSKLQRVQRQKRMTDTRWC